MQDMVLFLDQGYIQLYKLDFYKALSLNIKATVSRQQFLFPSNHAAGAYLWVLCFRRKFSHYVFIKQKSKNQW